MKLLLFLLFIFFSPRSHASEVSLDIGHTRSINNYFQLPNNNSNRVDLPSEKRMTLRTRLFWDINPKYFMYGLIAPLELDYQFQSQNSFQFDESTFNSNQSTRVNYKFNSYRVGFFRKWEVDQLKFWVGGVIKIRDAHIEVQQNTQSESYSDFGVVPLLGVGAQWSFKPKWSVFSHLDALGAAQGYAYDLQVEMRYKFLKNYSVGLGYRSLGGGADNDTLKNFAQFDTAYLSLIYE